jgi:hypothetical protein
MSRREPFLTLTITPIEIEVENCILTILEVSKYKLPWDLYQASCQVKCGDYMSKIFQIDFTDKDDLKRKILIEISKFKYLIFMYGREELKRRGIIM